MRKSLLFSMFCLLGLHCSFAQNTLNEKTKIKELCLVWGFLKYHHPEISKGKENIDDLFFKLYNKIEPAETQEELNSILLNLIDSYKVTYEYYDKNYSEKDNLDFFKNEDYNWIKNSNFSEALENKLRIIKNNYSYPKGYYASHHKLTEILTFDNEVTIENFDFRNTSHRLLTLSRFWNLINYYNVNKYLLDANWNAVLDDFIQPFLEAKTKTQYDVLKAKLVAKIDDSHVRYFPTGLNDSLFKYRPPFQTKIINDSIIISRIYNTNLCNQDSLEAGGIITRIKNIAINEYVQNTFSPYISISNKNILNKRVQNYVLANNKDMIEISYYSPSEKKSYKKTIHLYKTIDPDKSVLDSMKIKPVVIPSKEVGKNSLYINLEAITSKELKNLSKNFEKYKGLIFDLRGYPKSIMVSDIAKYLYPEKKEFINVLFSTKIPSIGDFNADAPLKLIKDPFQIGKKNDDYYKGQVILLVDNSTISRAEYLGTALQGAPNCITIGEITAGAVMNTVTVPFPDGDKINFTSMTAYYPNGEVIQRKGLKIDYIIHQSALYPNKDIQLEKALEFINNAKNPLRSSQN